MRFPQTGPPPLLDELLLDELDELDELLLLDDELEDASPLLLLLDDELEDASPLLLLPAAPLLLDDVAPFPPLPPDAWPLVFVPVEELPAPPAPPRFSSSGPSGVSLMMPVQAPRNRARAEMAKRVRCCMAGDSTADGFPIAT